MDFAARNLVLARDEIAIVQPDEVYEPPHGDGRPGEVLFRWSVADRAYRSNVGLREVPSRLLYDAGEDVLYLFYPTGRIGRIVAPGGANRTETVFAVAPWVPGAVAKLGDRILIADGESSDGLFVIDEEGRAALSFLARDDYVERLAAVEASQRVYLFGRHSGDEVLQRFGLNGARSPPRSPRFRASCSSWSPSAGRRALLRRHYRPRRRDTLAPIASQLVPSRVLAAWLGPRLVWGRGNRVESASFASPTPVVRARRCEEQRVASLTPLSKGALLAYETEGRSYPRTWTRFAKIFPGADLDATASRTSPTSPSSTRRRAPTATATASATTPMRSRTIATTRRTATATAFPTKRTSTRTGPSSPWPR